MVGFRRSELPTTTKVEKSIAAAANEGLIKPVAARMMPRALKKVLTNVNADTIGKATEVSEMQSEIEGQERQPRNQSDTETQRQIRLCNAGASFRRKGVGGRFTQM